MLKVFIIEQNGDFLKTDAVDLIITNKKVKIWAENEPYEYPLENIASIYIEEIKDKPKTVKALP